MDIEIRELISFFHVYLFKKGNAHISKYVYAYAKGNKNIKQAAYLSIPGQNMRRRYVINRM
jgi:hypothetical protein